MKKPLLLILLALILFGCNKVTETGNPCPIEGCGDAANGPVAAEPTAQSSNVYTNAKYNVTIPYPSTWKYVEASNQDQVTFYDASTDITTLTVSFAIPEVASSTGGNDGASSPASTPSACTRSNYSTSTLTGHEYDCGTNDQTGSDRKLYTFSTDSLIISVDAEIFTTGESGTETIINGITIN